VEVFHLTDNANLAIPEDVRKQYQRDEHGRVLFFTTPPLDVLPPVKKGAAMAHTTRYLAEKLRKAGALKEATAQKEMARRREEAESRKRKHEEETVQAKTVQELMDESLMVLIEQMEHATDMAWKSIYGDKWEEGKKFEMERLAARQAEHLEKVRLLSENARKRQEAERLERANCLKGPPGGVYLDDIDPRY
jgi:chromatin structure-remodeling complex subunit RSC1/2